LALVYLYLLPPLLSELSLYTFNRHLSPRILGSKTFIWFQHFKYHVALDEHGS
jgi:hypothetical protein